MPWWCIQQLEEAKSPPSLLNNTICSGIMWISIARESRYFLMLSCGWSNTSHSSHELSKWNPSKKRGRAGPVTEACAGEKGVCVCLQYRAQVLLADTISGTKYIHMRIKITVLLTNAYTEGRRWRHNIICRYEHKPNLLCDFYIYTNARLKHVQRCYWNSSPCVAHPQHSTATHIITPAFPQPLSAITLFQDIDQH